MLDIQYIFLDNKERILLTKEKQEYLIEQVQKTDVLNIVGNNTINMRLYHPVKEIIIIPKRSDISLRNQWTNFSNNDSINMDVNINKGKILYKGNDLSKIRKRQIPKLRRDIGMIFQDYKLLEDRTVYDNVALPLEISGEKNNLIKDKVFLMLKKVGSWIGSAKRYVSNVQREVGSITEDTFFALKCLEKGVRMAWIDVFMYE